MGSTTSNTSGGTVTAVFRSTVLGEAGGAIQDASLTPPVLHAVAPEHCAQQPNNKNVAAVIHAPIAPRELSHVQGFSGVQADRSTFAVQCARPLFVCNLGMLDLSPTYTSVVCMNVALLHFC